MANHDDGILDLGILPRAHLLPRKSAAKIIGVECNTLATWASTRRYDLPFVRIGSRAFYKVGDVLDFIERNTLNNNSKGVAK